jgi:hypothetical protein
VIDPPDYDEEPFGVADLFASSSHPNAPGAAAVPPPDEPRPRAPAVAELPQIIITTDQAATVDAAQDALLKRGGVYVRARTLVTVVRDRGDTDWLRRPTGTPVVQPVRRERLREMCGAAAAWAKWRQRGDNLEIERSMVPSWVPATLMERGEWRFPVLDGISDVPVMRADGTIHDTPGYDERSRVIYDPCGVTFPRIPDQPTRGDAEDALGDLLEPFVDFPPVAASDKAAIAALILSIIARSAIDGCVPIFVASAPVAGTGKGLLIDVATLIATGRESPKMAPTNDDNEMRKRLLALAIEAPPIVTIDNVEGALGSESLASAVTAGTVHDRILGASETRAVPVRSVFAATGNNVQLKSDLGRRAVPIDLDPGVEHPEDRGDWTHPNVKAYVRAERPRLVAAALTVLRAFVVAGRPKHGLSTKGSFEAWDELVRGAIIFAGGADPLGGVQRVRDQADEDLDRLRALLGAWQDTIGGLQITVADALKRAGDSGTLYDALASYCPRTGKPAAQQIGMVLRKVRGRVVSGMRFMRGDSDRNDVRLWQVESVGG